MAVMYAIIISQDMEDENCSQLLDHNFSHKAFAVLVGFLGVNDYIMWYLRKFIKREQNRLRQRKMMEIASLSMIQENVSIDEQIEMMRRQANEKKKIRTTIKSRSDLKHALIPERPSNLYKDISYARSPADRDRRARSPTHRKLRALLKEMSIKPNTSGNTINKALRREVLAYTTGLSLFDSLKIMDFKSLKFQFLKFLHFEFISFSPMI